ncbi:hypothetical protein [Geothrix sp. PMB-07]|uniref:hypothetical protein n=1 Tax=Geothrix sp. PMB-07 TaxID=3068640 RepID=UPI002741A0B1|nr:hypothetical protein [Geothrix sp. PMB-07]WLT30290.1 hypothetical protein Q9293_11230 [Geothrix sp. PMB-07]
MIKVYIIECIDPRKEDQIGIQCAERFIYPRAEQENVAISVAEPKDKYEITKLLNDAYFEMRELGKPCPPIVLHIDAHGSENGFKTRNGEMFTWEEFSTYCQQLSKISNIQLVVIMGTCKGGYSMEMLKPYDQAPFYCIFGPGSNINNYDLMNFYRDFYNELMTNKRFDVVAKNIIKQYGDKIMYVSSLFLFQSLYKTYMIHQTRRFGIIRKNRMINKIKKLNITKEEKIKKIEYINKENKLTIDQFPRFRRQFFLIDEYPENENRFKDVTIEAIMNNEHIPVYEWHLH